MSAEKYGSGRHKVTGKWRKCYNKDLYTLFKPRRMRGWGQEAYYREIEIKKKVSCQTCPLGGLGVDGELFNTHTHKHICKHTYIHKHTLHTSNIHSMKL